MLLRAMERSVNVSLSIDVGSDPISGVLAAGVDQDPRQFHGWVELAGAIEDIRCRRGGGRTGETRGWIPGASGEEHTAGLGRAD
jgi:hypothetical protein